MELDINRLHVAILFAILFVSVGWVAPAAYASYAPQEQFMEVHNFDAQDTTTSSERHLICLDRTVQEGHLGKIFVELRLIGEDNSVATEVDAQTMDRYFQSGHLRVETPMTLPATLEPGRYRYLMVIQMELANGRVQREFSYTSDAFNITEGPPTNNTTTADFTC
jgi:hypothetical protein